MQILSGVRVQRHRKSDRRRRRGAQTCPLLSARSAVTMVARRSFLHRSVAQPGSALDWGSRGRRFESCRSDQKRLTRGARRSCRAASPCRVHKAVVSVFAIKSPARSHGVTKDRQAEHYTPVALWLLFVAFLVLAMVVVGGATRLTGSGLSITQWKPITGAIPPLSHKAWLRTFALYQATPQYRLVNQGMSLASFQFIFWWEWAHRLLGRLLGVAFLLPFLHLSRPRATAAPADRALCCFVHLGRPAGRGGLVDGEERAGGAHLGGPGAPRHSSGPGAPPVHGAPDLDSVGGLEGVRRWRRGRGVEAVGPWRPRSSRPVSFCNACWGRLVAGNKAGLDRQ